MITAIIETEDGKIRTVKGDAVIAIALSEITDDTSGVEVGITGDIRPMQTARAFGSVVAEMLKDFANDADIPEPILSAAFLKQFLKRRERANGTTT